VLTLKEFIAAGAIAINPNELFPQQLVAMEVDASDCPTGKS